MKELYYQLYTGTEEKILWEVQDDFKVIKFKCRRDKLYRF